MTSTLIRLAVAGSFAVVAAIFGPALLETPEPGAALASKPLPAIRVATRTFQVGTFLDAGSATFQDWSGKVTDDMVTRDVHPGQDVVGSVVVAPIVAGEPITRSKLLMPGQEGFLAAVLRPGMRAISIAVDAVSGNAGHIFPGDRIDVILTQDLHRFDVAATGQRLATETILQDVRVIAVDQNLNEDLKQRDTDKIARTITLEVDQTDAQKVTLASGLGKLSLSLRSLLRNIENQPAGTADPAASAALEQAAPPVWAEDVSSALRGNLPREAGGPPAAAPVHPVRVLRGAASAVTSE
ncbi:Flp pilus assembly protein CpaB [Geminicoccus roseus]|uniref:Flp pilus assembly protein CpaB n=1 Tax=Geminicoccus roseus TaxID=404900 RepID=UPI0003FF83CD|nr:Flp pilus assembly protein CpaB [Geminicoccus roseus]